MKRRIQVLVLLLILSGCVMHDRSEELPQMIYVGGDVREPGKYALVSDMTVRDAIDAAGGFTEWASAVQLKRGTNLVYRAYGRRLFDGREPLHQQLQKNDLIFVEHTY